MIYPASGRCSILVKRTNLLLVLRLNRQLGQVQRWSDHSVSTSRSVPNPLKKASMNFSSQELMFVQSQPQMGNPFDQDAPLKNHLKLTLPPDMFLEIEKDLRRFGQRAVNELEDLHRRCEIEQPYLRQYDPWGNRVDQIITSSAWKRMHDISAEEGLVSIAYERKYGPWSRVYQIAKNYIFASRSGLYSCPLAMTDGAARILESLDQSDHENGVYAKAFHHLTSRDPAIFWTSGQWMTERRGGSDVANGTETAAIPLDEFDDNRGNSTHALFGNKWFSSATDSNMALTLARLVDSDGNVQTGSKGLSLFYVETHGESGKLNKIEIVKMKNKLGTRQLPTAELILGGTMARLVGQPGKGVSSISKMLTITRIHNAISAVSYMRKVLSLSRDYATKRRAFGKLLKDHPLHMHTLAQMEVEIRGAFVFLFEVARLLGLEECGQATDDQKQLLRILTPLLKLFTGKQAVSVISEGLESFGGQGYIEDIGIANILRDAQVLPIWEGTTNILSLDVVRAIKTSKSAALSALLADASERVNYSPGRRGNSENDTSLSTESSMVVEGFEKLKNFSEFHREKDTLEHVARPIAISLAQLYIGALLLGQATKTNQLVDHVTAKRWCHRGLLAIHDDVTHYSQKGNEEDTLMVMEGFPRD